MKPRCVCGCRRRSVQLHHVVYRQELRRYAAADPVVPANIREVTLVNDSRNLVPVAALCHSAHHGRSRPLTLAVLPDSVFEFAVELMGAGAAYEYLRRRYAGEDWRLEELLARSERD